MVLSIEIEQGCIMNHPVFGMVLRIEIEQGQGFIMNHPVFYYHPPNHLEE